MNPTQPPSDVQVQANAKPKSKRRKLGWILICVVSILAGAVAPLAFGAHQLLGSHSAKKNVDEEKVIIPFGDAVVNLSESRMTRYLRLKIVLQVDAGDVKDITKR